MGLLFKIRKYKWILNIVARTDWKNKKKIVSGFMHANQYYKVDDVQVNMKNLLKCTLCPNMCRFECPVLQITQKEMYAPATKARLMYHMERGDIDSKDLHTAEVAYMCTNCNGCQTWCPMDISTGDLLRDVRADLIKKEVYIPGIKEFDDKLTLNQTAFRKDTFTEDKTLNVIMDKPEVFYYIGCVMAEKKPEAAHANIKILKHLGIKFCTYTNERTCCGTPAYTLGFRDTIKDFASKNLALFEKSGAKIIVSDCPACTTAIKNSYKDLGFKHDYEVLTIAQYYMRLIQEGKLKPEKPVKMSITFHDPCYSARGLEDQGSALNDPVNINKKKFEDSARFVFNSIPDLLIKEVYQHGKELMCCGRGGVCHIHHPDVADAIGKKRVDQLNAVGADAITSACPSCEEGLIYNGAGECLDIAEILIKSLNIQ